MSLNQVLWYTTPDSPLIATLEMDGWSFENGGYTRRVIPRPDRIRPAKPAPRPGRRRRVLLQHRPGPPPVDLQPARLRRCHHLGDRHRPLGPALVPVRGAVPVLNESRHSNRSARPEPSGMRLKLAGHGEHEEVFLLVFVSFPIGARKAKKALVSLGIPIHVSLPVRGNPRTHFGQLGLESDCFDNRFGNREDSASISGRKRVMLQVYPSGSQVKHWFGISGHAGRTHRTITPLVETQGQSSSSAGIATARA